MTESSAGSSGTAVLDLNADLGEGFGIWKLTDDEGLLKYVTSANVACGFHAGDPVIMRRVCEMARSFGVTIGAQVSYRDLAGFGRREMGVAPIELGNDVLYQIGALDGICRTVGASVRYVKPHGALNNRMWWDAEQAASFALAVHSYDAKMPVLVIPGSALERAVREVELIPVIEAYPDRNYSSDGNLVRRTESEAVIEDVDKIVERVREIVETGTLRSITGEPMSLSPRSLCVHGDNPSSVAAARRIHDLLQDIGVQLESFA